MSPSRQSTRRDFLHGRSAVDGLADLAQGAADSPESLASATRSYLVHVSRRAMACQFEVFFNAGQYQDDTASALETLDLVDRLEDQMSVYRQDSEICRINREAFGKAVDVESGLFSLFQLAMRVSAETLGAYDITSNPLSRAWGFFRRAGEVPSEEQIREAKSRVGWDSVRLDPKHSRVEFLKPGIELNVNSLGKGFALDCCAKVLEDLGIRDFLYHGGQSSVLARGESGTGGNGWSVGLLHPLRPEKRLAEFMLRDRALSTSGTGTQFFHAQGKRYGHILDPRTGLPASGVYSATVTAPSAALSDALSTACYVLGPEQSVALCRRFPGVACVLVCPGARAGSIAIETHGLEKSDWRLHDFR